MKIRIIFATLLALLPLGHGAQIRQRLVIIVNLNNPIQELTHAQLEAIYRLKLHRLPNGSEVKPVMMDATTPEMKIMLSRVYHMDRDELARYWMSLIFSGEVVSLPKTVDGTLPMLTYIQKDPTAIGFLIAGRENANVKVLKIDGKLHTDRDYLLAMD